MRSCCTAFWNFSAAGAEKNMNKHRKHGFVFLAVGFVILLTGVVLWGKNLQTAQAAGERADRLLSQVEQTIATQPASASSAAPALQSQSVKVKSASAVPAFTLPERAGSIGILRIPSLELTLPVQAQYSAAALQTSPSRYTGEHGEISRFVICGHSYRRHFGTLQLLQTGAAVSFTNMDGTVFSYHVSEVTEIAPDDISALQSGDWDLSLFTCSPTGKKRILVRCQLDR